MLAFTAAAFLAFVSSALALQVTTPANGATWESDSYQLIAWKKVPTDPSSFAVTLVHQVGSTVGCTLLSDARYMLKADPLYAGFSAQHPPNPPSER